MEPQTATEPALSEDGVREGWVHAVTCGNVTLGAYPKRGDAVASVLMTWPDAQLVQATRCFTKYRLPGHGNPMRMENEATIVLVACPSHVAPLLVSGK
jgi:hypothetical protein